MTTEIGYLPVISGAGEKSEFDLILTTFVINSTFVSISS